MNVVYISGPISNIPGGNFDKFAAAESHLRHNGYKTINPHEICAHIKRESFSSDQAHWRACMNVCVKAIPDADFIAVLPGWRVSKGARAEVSLGVDLDIPVLEAFTLKPLEVVAVMVKTVDSLK